MANSIFEAFRSYMNFVPWQFKSNASLLFYLNLSKFVVSLMKVLLIAEDYV